MWNGNFYVIVKQRQANAHIYTHYDCSWATVSWGGCLLHALLHCCKQCDSSRESFGSDQCPGRSHVQQSTACVHPTSITITAACYTSNINTTITISPKINTVLLITITTVSSITICKYYLHFNNYFTGKPWSDMSPLDWCSTFTFQKFFRDKRHKIFTGGAMGCISCQSVTWQMLFKENTALTKTSSLTSSFLYPSIPEKETSLHLCHLINVSNACLFLQKHLF